MKYIPFILFTVMTNAAAQIMLKQGMMSLGPRLVRRRQPGPEDPADRLQPVGLPRPLTFVISMASHLYVLSKVELSFAYPFLSLAYVAVAVFAYFVFREDLNAWRIAGIGLICVGTVLIAQGGARPCRRASDFGFPATRSDQRACTMKHIIFGGDGFVGRHLAPNFSPTAQEVVVADIAKSDLPHYRDVRFIQTDVTDPAAVARSASAPTTWSTTSSAKMLSPIQVRAKRHEFFWPVNFHGTENIIAAMDKAGAPKLVHFTTDMIYGHTVHVPEDRGPSGRAARRIRHVEAGDRGARGRLARARHEDLAVPPAAHHRARPPRHPGEAVQADRPQPAGADDRLGQEPLPVHLGVRLRRGRPARLEGRRAERRLQSRLAQPAAGAESSSAT